jgi:hypothetical protein
LWLSPLLRTEIVLGTEARGSLLPGLTFLQVSYLLLEQNTELRYKDPQVKEMNDTSLIKRILTHTAQTQVAVTSDSNYPRLLQIAD